MKRKPCTWETAFEGVDMLEYEIRYMAANGGRGEFDGGSRRPGSMAIFYCDVLRAILEKLMPYKSKAQAAKFHDMLKRGQIQASTVKEFDSASKGKKLPQYAKRKRAK